MDERDEIEEWRHHAEPGRTVERDLQMLRRFSRNAPTLGRGGQAMAKTGGVIVAITLGAVLVILLVIAIAAAL